MSDMRVSLILGAALSGAWDRTFGQAGKSVQALKGKVAALEAKQAALMDRRSVMRGQLFDAAAIGMLLSAPLKAAVDFESAMADVRKVVDFPESGGFEQLGKTIKEMARWIPVSQAGLAEIAAAGGQLGIKAPDLPGFIETVAKMATAFDMLPAEAGDAMAKLSNIYGLSISDMGRVGDAINHLSDNTAAKSREIVNAMARVGGVARKFGLTEIQTAALTDAFIALGKPPEVAGTAINAMLLKLKTATKQNEKFTDALESMGISASQLERDIGRDAQGALMKFLKTLQKVPDRKQMGVLSDLFGLEYSDDIAVLVSNLDKYQEALNLVADEHKYLGSMTREFQNRAATTANNLQLFKNNINEVAINAGSVLLPELNQIISVLRSGSTALAEFAEAHPQVTRAIAGTLTSFAALKIAQIGLAYGWTYVQGGMLAAQKGILLVGRAVLGLLSPIGLVVAALAAAAAAVYKYWQPIEAYFQGLGQGIRRAFEEAGLGNVWDGFMAGVDRVKGVLNRIGTWFKDLLKPVQLSKEEFMAWADQGRSSGLTVGRALVAAYQRIQGVWAGAKDLFSGIWGGIRSAAVTAWEAIKPTATGAWEAVKSAWSGAGTFFAGVWEDIKAAAPGAWDSIKSGAGTAWDALKGTVTARIEAIGAVIKGFKEGLSGVGSEIKEILAPAFTTLKEALAPVGDALKPVWEALEPIGDAIKELFAGKEQDLEGLQAVGRVLGEIFGEGLKMTATAIAGAIERTVAAGKLIGGVLGSLSAGDWAGAGEQIKEALGGAGEVVERIGTGISDALKWLKDKAWPVAGDALKAAFEGAKTTIDGLVSALGSAYQWVSEKAWNGLETAFGGAQTVIGDISKALDTAVGWLRDEAWSAAGKALGDAFEAAEKVVARVKEAIGEALDWIAQKMEPVTRRMGKIVDKAGSIWGRIFGGNEEDKKKKPAGETPKGRAKPLKIADMDDLEDAEARLRDIGDAIKETKAAWPEVLGAAQTTFGEISKLLGQTETDMLAAGGRWMGALASGIRGGAGLPVQAVSGVADQVIARLGGIENQFATAGGKMMSALAEGIKSKAGEPAAAAGDALSKIKPLLPHSDAKEGPLSTLTASGRAIAETLGAGVRGASPELKRAVEEALAKIDTARIPPAWMVQNQGGGPVRAGENVTQHITIHVQGAPGQDPRAIADEVRRVLEDVERDRERRRRGALYD